MISQVDDNVRRAFGEISLHGLQGSDVPVNIAEDCESHNLVEPFLRIETPLGFPL